MLSTFRPSAADPADGRTVRHLDHDPQGAVTPR